MVKGNYERWSFGGRGRERGDNGEKAKQHHQASAVSDVISVSAVIRRQSEPNFGPTLYLLPLLHLLSSLGFCARPHDVSPNKLALWFFDHSWERPTSPCITCSSTVQSQTLPCHPLDRPHEKPRKKLTLCSGTMKYDAHRCPP